MKAETIKKSELFGSLPEEWPIDLRPEIQRQVRNSHCKVVVLDDDPTGTQTVHGVPVLKDWSMET